MHMSKPQVPEMQGLTHRSDRVHTRSDRHRGGFEVVQLVGGFFHGDLRSIRKSDKLLSSDGGNVCSVWFSFAACQGIFGEYVHACSGHVQHVVGYYLERFTIICCEQH